MAGAPLGNKNAARSKAWQAAIERALDRMGDPSINPDVPLERAPRMKALDELADKFIAACRASDLGFFKEFGDRMDGKAAQQLQIGGDGSGEPLVVEITRFADTAT